MPTSRKAEKEYAEMPLGLTQYGKNRKGDGSRA
jgi:hypothetical protein